MRPARRRRVRTVDVPKGRSHPTEGVPISIPTQPEHTLSGQTIQSPPSAAGMYFHLLDSQIDINQAFALAWAQLTGSVFGAVLANAATLANTVAHRADLAHHTEIRTGDTEIRTSDASRRVDETADRPCHQYLVADEVFDEVVELLVVADITDAAR